MIVITFTAIKGGVGKSSLAILTANYLRKSGFKVLGIDLDIQNSFSHYYLPEIESKKNIASALHEGNLTSNIINANIDIIQSSFNLINLRVININTLSRLKEQISDYDYVIIDTAPTIDNIVLNGACISDYLITPIYYTLFDYKSALFYKEVLQTETDKINNWRLLINKFKAPRTDNSAAEINQYIKLFDSNFNNILKAKIVDSVLIQKAIDTKTAITQAMQKERLYNSMVAFIQELLHIKAKPENF
jgi:chromosome partitioning protein